MINSFIILATLGTVLLGGSGTFAFLKNRANKNADIIVGKTEKAISELEGIHNPTRLVTDSMTIEISSKYKTLQKECLKLVGSRLVSNENKEKIKNFIRTYSNINELQRENNRIYHIVEIVDKNLSVAIDDLYRLLDCNHYFRHSECELYLEKHKDLINAIISLTKSRELKYVKNFEAATYLQEKCLNLEDTRKKHNDSFVKKELESNSSFFDTVLQYPLDPQQRESIVKLEDNCLVIASAGSGKTSTMMGKINYLTQKRNIDPDQILTITYTRKAAEELSSRLNNRYLRCLTFHALALDIIGKATGEKPTIASNELFLNVFYTMLKQEDFMAAILRYVEELQNGMMDAFDYETASEFFTDRKKYGIQSLYADADGKIVFTKSEEEKKICTYLTRLGVRWKYEEAYPIKTLDSDYRQYKPDFTILYQDKEGNEKKIYLEHFAINEKGEVPKWFGDGKIGGWNQANKEYNQSIVWKKGLHKDNGTTLIYTTSDDFHKGKIQNKLKWFLEHAGVPLKERGEEELYSLCVARNKSLEKSIMNMCQGFVFLMKANGRSIEWALDKARQSERDTEVIRRLMKPISEAYENELKKRREIDFTDAILMATQICEKGKWRSYEYILVDEFQDISIDRYRFLQALRGNGQKEFKEIENNIKTARLYCVGDDWQSIYRFSGSDMSLFSQFSEYFGYTEECRIETTYRFNQPLIDISSMFVQKNPIQKKKKVKPFALKENDSSTEISQIGYTDENAYEKLCDEMKKIPEDAPVYIIGRYTYDVNTLGKEHVRYDMTRQKITVIVGNRIVPFLTIHASKGLEADYVFMLNCNSGNYGFPSQISDDPVLEYVLSKADDYEYSEERRVFYVGITRAKKKTVLMYNADKPSVFVTELFDVNPPEAKSCPICKTGYRVRISGGVAKNGTQYANWACSNYMAGCPYKERVFENK